MKSSLLGTFLSVYRWTRFTRRLGAVGAFIVAATAASAQSLAFQTLAGTPGVTTPFSNSAPVTFRDPQGVAADGAGNVYVADTSNHVIRKITAGGVVSTLAGIAGSAGADNDPNPGAPSARFNAPQGIAINAAGDRIYVADTGSHLIRVISLSAAGGTVTSVATVAGTTNTSGASNSAPITFNAPRGIVADTLGNLYVADSGNHLVRKIVISGATVTTVAGLAGSAGFATGDHTVATFHTPYGITINATNDILYVADFGTHLIRRIALTTPVAVSNFAGTAGSAGFVDAPGLGAAFRNPTGVAMDATGNVLVVDFGNHAIRQISPGGSVLTIAGPAATGGAAAGQSGIVNGTGNQVRFTGPVGIAVKTVSGVMNVYVADTNNQLIRQGAPPSAPTVAAASPATQNASVGANGVTFTSTVTGGFPLPTLQWQIQPGGVGAFQNLTTSTVYQGVNTATLTINGVTSGMNNDRFRLVATSGTTVVEGAAATLTVNQAPVFSGSSINFTAVVGRDSTFIVAASGTSPITYSISGAGTPPTIINGTNFVLNANGTITGTPTSTGQSTSFTVTATNGVGSATQFVTINVVPETSGSAPVITSGSSATFSVGQNNNFTITASGAPTPLVGLSGSLPAGVTFVNGLLSGTPVSPDNATYVLTATATNSLGTTTQSFTLNVTAATIVPTITSQPTNAIGNLGGSVTFTAAAAGSPAPNLRWQRQAAAGGGFADIFDGGNYSGATTTVLTVSNLEPGMINDQFRLVATNTHGTATSNSVLLTVNVGTIISTFAGQTRVAGRNDGVGLSAQFNNPAGIAVDGGGNIYVADSANHVIRKISPGGVVSTYAGLAGVSGSEDGTGAAARFRGPFALAVNFAGTVYVADTFNNTIRVISSGGVVTTLAGLANSPGSADGAGSAARFSQPNGIAADNFGNVYVADSANHTIRRVGPDGVVATIAGAAGIAGSGDNNVGTNARFNYPGNLAVDVGGTLYVADTLNHTIRRITNLGAVSTVAGLSGVAGATDAIGTAATFNRPQGVAVDGAGNIYVADTGNNLIRRISSVGTVTTVAGAAGQTGSTDGAGGQARFDQPYAVAVDGNGNLYISDTRNQTIRRSGTTSAPGIITQPQNRVVPIGGTTTFSVVATGAPAPSFQWQRQAGGVGDFVSLSNDGLNSGVNTATLTVTNVSSANNGDRYRVVLANGVNPNATSDAATLTIGEPPTFTNVANATVRATEALAFTFATAGTPASTFTAGSDLPAFLLLSPSGFLAGTPPAGSEGTYTFTVTANNGATATQSFTLTVTPAVVPPSITTQPAAATVDQGQSATFTVVAAGTAPLSHQWRLNGVAIPGATTSSYTVANAQPSNAGSYSVVVSNSAGAIISNAAQLVVNTIPVFGLQPGPQVALAGSTVTFNTAVSGGTAFSYQWRRNGVPIAGANNASFTITAVTDADVGNYDVQVSNSLGTIRSSLAQLTIVGAPVAPVITMQPITQAVQLGAPTTLFVSASGAPTPSYQWRKDGVAISGATTAGYAISSVQSAHGGAYDVVISNSAGSVTSNVGFLRVVSRSYAGTYFGDFAGNLGPVALHVRADNSASFVGFATSNNTGVVGQNFVVNDNGSFAFTQSTAGSIPVSVTGSINENGSVGGTAAGGINLNFGATAAPVAGPSAAYTGFHRGGAQVGSAQLYLIVGANSRVVAVAQSGATADGGLGAISSSGGASIATTRSVIIASLASDGTFLGSITGAIAATFQGGSESALAQQRLANISSRARVASGDAVAIAGFVISGEQSKPVLIRAVGPTLGAAPFNVPGALASPRLELFRGSTSLAVNSGIAANRVAIDAAGQQAGAFALGAAGGDAAILTTLAPGNYTAVVSSTTNTAGVALVEVYDLSAPAPGQKLLNISTRASAGTNENTLIAGFVVPPGPAKRVLIRGIGPGLTPLGVGGALPSPLLNLIGGNNAPLAQNSNWSTSVDAAAISAASVQVGAFTMANADAALIVTLAPGNYTAQVTGANNATGVALIEVYELP